MTEVEPAEHRASDGHLKGWTAAEVSEDELVDDDWIAENTKEVKDGLEQSDSSEGS